MSEINNVVSRHVSELLLHPYCSAAVRLRSPTS